MLHSLLAAAQNHPQAASIGGFFAALKLLRVVFLLLVHPIGLVILFSVIAAIVCALVAGNRGRNRLGWGLLGLLFSIVTLIVLLVLPRRN